MGNITTSIIRSSHVPPRNNHKHNAFTDRCPLSSPLTHPVSGLPFYTELQTIALANLDGVPVTMEILEILRCLAFVSTRFGYSAFQEYNFVYLSSIDILASHPTQTLT